jgi:hypothetical protein
MNRGGKQHQNEQGVQIFVLNNLDFHKKRPAIFKVVGKGLTPLYANNSLFYTPSQAIFKAKN